MPTMVEITKASRARAAKALALRRQGKLLKEIGAELGVGVDRARCLVAKGERLEARSKLPRDGQCA
jgi:orotate phosphoribosyltransferase-like protein